MGHLTIAQINTALATTLGAAQGIVRIQDAANDGTAENNTTSISEGMNDTPTLQVYWEEGNTDSQFPADRTSFGAGIRQTDLTFYADVYVTQRGNIGEDMARVLPLASALWDVLEAQRGEPYFGLAGIKGFLWTARRVTFEYGSVHYAGIRFTIPIKVF